jgi:hypothetical protein
MLIRSRNRDRSRGGSVALSSLATGYLNGVTPYHYADFITNRMLYAGADVGTVAGGTGYSFSRASDGYYTNADGTLTLFGSGALRRGDRGVLIEGSRTNLLLRSQEFDNASWTKNRATITANATTAPDGTLTADKLVEDNTATNTHRTFQNASTTGQAYAFTVFAKASERNWMYLRIDRAGPSTPAAWFDLSAGTVGTVNTGLTAAIQALANGWYRCRIVVDTADTANNSILIGLATGDNVLNYTGDNTSGIFIWGAQLEAASFASSYIPTVAAAATRASDVLTYTVNTTAQINAAVAGQPELNTSGAPGLQGAATAATYNATTFAGAATRVDVSNQSFVVFSGFTAGAFVAVTVECLTGSVLTRQSTLTNSGGSFTAINAGQTITSILPASASGTIGIASTANGTTSTFTVHSVKEVPANSLTLYPLQLWSEFERAVDTGGTEVMVRASFDNNNLADVGVNGSDLAELQMVAGGSSQGFPSVAGAVALNTVTKIAGRFNTNSMQLARGGTLGTEDTTATLPTNPTTLFIGAGNATRHSFGYIRRIAVIQGAGTDAQLQSMTT